MKNIDELINKLTINGIKNTATAAIALLINLLVAPLISLSSLAITALPKSIDPIIINNTGIPHWIIDKIAFKKRLRAIYMSNSDSSVQILMGADDFADFLQLSQLIFPDLTDVDEMITGRRREGVISTFILIMFYITRNYHNFEEKFYF